MKVRNGAAFDAVLNRQHEWARRADVLHNGSSTPTLAANLFRPLRDETFKEFESADGAELSGKMRALISSSALAVNVFDFWRSRPAEIGACLGIDDVTSLRFEQKYPLFNGFLPPPSAAKDWTQANVDVELAIGDGTKAVALECKFTEPFRKFEDLKKPFGDTYFRPAARFLWSDMENTYGYSLLLNSRKEQFEHLAPAQLIKTALASKRKFGIGNFKVIYVWFSVIENQKSIEECAALRSEAKHFCERTMGEVPLEVLTWQEVFLAIKEAADANDAAYISYLQDRYFW